GIGPAHNRQHDRQPGPLCPRHADRVQRQLVERRRCPGLRHGPAGLAPGGRLGRPPRPANPGTCQNRSSSPVRVEVVAAVTKGVQDLMVEVARVRDAFYSAIYSAADLDEAMALPATGCALADDVLPHLPADLTFRRISRTGDRWRLAQEDMASFTHDLELPWLLPGVAPTHRRAEVLAISVITVQRSLITSHRTLWDQATLLTQ